MKMVSPLELVDASKEAQGAQPDGLRSTAKGHAWPAPLQPAAFHGVTGEFVRAIEPHSEADVAGILIHFLVAFGNLIGRGPHFMVGGTPHFSNLNAVLVGATASRKGTAKADTFFAIRDLDASWIANRVQSGLSSGEGLIWGVRDPIEEQQAIKEKGRVVGYENVIVDPGVTDKRLLLIEPEFGSTLRVMERDGNTLSAQIRQAWDSGELRVLTKTKAQGATNAHISILGHVTRDELLKYLGETERANGFANRILWVAVCRSKFLPEGGELRGVDFSEINLRLKEAKTFASARGELQRSPSARELWHKEYERLSSDRVGMLGAVTSRAEAQVMRIAMIYALLDQSEVIEIEHLEAALAVWQYCEDSARSVFGDALGNAGADRILAALRVTPNGMTRTDINALFAGNLPAEKVNRALTLLSEHGLAYSQKDDPSGGRRADRWFATTKETK